MFKVHNFKSTTIINVFRCRNFHQFAPSSTKMTTTTILCFRHQLGRANVQILRLSSRGFLSAATKSRLQSMLEPILSPFRNSTEKLDADEEQRRCAFLAEFEQGYYQFKRDFTFDPTLNRRLRSEHVKQMLEDFNEQNAYRGLKIVRHDGIVEKFLDPENAGPELFMMAAFFVVMLILINLLHKSISPESQHPEIMRGGHEISFEQLLREYLPAKLVRHISYYPDKNVAVILMEPDGYLNGKEAKNTFIKFDSSDDLGTIKRKIKKAEAGIPYTDTVHISSHETPEGLYNFALCVYFFGLLAIIAMILLKRNFHVEALTAAEMPLPQPKRKAARARDIDKGN